MKIWRFSFRIAHLKVRVEGNAPACRSAVRNLTGLFQACSDSAEPSLSFRLQQQPSGTIVLLRNGTELWRSSDAGEAVAAFEWHLYGESVQLLAPRLLSLHAAAVSRGPKSGEAMLIAGPGGDELLLSLADRIAGEAQDGVADLKI